MYHGINSLHGFLMQNLPKNGMRIAILTRKRGYEVLYHLSVVFSEKVVMFNASIDLKISSREFDRKPL